MARISITNLHGDDFDPSIMSPEDRETNLY